MPEFRSFGAGFWSKHDVKIISDLAQFIDGEAAFDSFWLAEVSHYRSAIPLLTACALKTRRLRLGSGILPSHSRHPSTIAMEAATLSELSDQRFILGIGSAHVAAKMSNWKLGQVEPMRDSLRIVRALLRGVGGENLTYDGKVFQVKSVKLGLAPQAVPLYVGAYPTSSKILSLAAELADGVILLWTTPSAVRKAVNLIRDAARRSGRNPDTIDIGAYLNLYVDSDADAARKRARSVIEFYLPRIRDQWIKNGLVSQSEANSLDTLTERLTIAGSPRTCVEELEKYAEAGLQTPIFYEIQGPDRKESIKTIAKEIIPSFKN